ncbi:MAG: hypothetical protein MZU91_12920 [Desulfosudis oleivorans]|nr:hypothetical protein [Desulfosudis oleivorans]
MTLPARRGSPRFRLSAQGRPPAADCPSTGSIWAGAGGFGEGWMLSMVRQVRTALGRIGIEVGTVAI